MSAEVQTGRQRYGNLTNVAVDTELEILCKREAFDPGNIAQVKKPDVGQYLPLPNIACQNTAENVDLNLNVGCRINPRQLG
jgi:hypothetical protein